MNTISLSLGALMLSLPVFAGAADLEKGRLLVAQGGCAVCHGASMDAPIAPDYPKLAGQHGDYTYHVLRAYQIPNNPLVGRNHPIMASQMNANPGIVDQYGKPRPFTPSELRDMAAYLESLPGSLVLKK